MRTRLCAAALAAAVWILPLAAEAACPAWIYVDGTNGTNTLSSKVGKPTRFRAGGNIDTYKILDKPEFFSDDGCTSRDHWVEILGYQTGEVVWVKGPLGTVRKPACQTLYNGGSGRYVWWGADSENFFIIRGCSGYSLANLVLKKLP